MLSMAVLAGGALGCGGDDPGPARTGANGDQSAAPPTPTPAAEAAPGPDPVAGEAPDGSAPAGTGTAGQGADDLARDDPAGGSAAEASGSATAKTPQLSPGPVLEWTEFDPGFDDLFQLESVGDGRVVARAWTDDGGDGLFGRRIVVSADGTGWTEVALPEGLFPEQVDVSSDRWVVAGQFLDSGRPEEAVDRVFFSDDRGSTWTELALDLPPASMPPYWFERWRASLVLVSGEQMVLALSGSAVIDGQALLEDAGRLPAGKRVVFTLPTPDGVSFSLIDADALNQYGSLAATPWALAAVYALMDGEALPEPSFEELVLTYDEVDSTEAELFDPFVAGAGPGNRILASAGAAFEVVAGFDGWVVSGAATGEGFIVTAVDHGGDTVLSSRDGLAWSVDPSPGPPSSVGTVAADGTIWWVMSEAAESFDLQQGRLGEAPTTVATFDGLPLPPPAVGPAGIVVAAERYSSGSPLADQGLPAEARVARDGYELRYNEAEDALALWDLAEGAVIHEFGPEQMQSETPPDGVRVVFDGGLPTMVFEDPETGADLVTFTTDDVALLVGMANAQLEAGSSGDPGGPELWVGWSADGTAWGLQRMADAFGIHGAVLLPEFAVGGDFVIARVASFQPPDPGDPTGNGPVLPTRWFLARVP